MSAGVLAIDVGGTSTKVAVVSRRGEIGHWRSFPTAAPLAQYKEQLTRAASETVAAAKGEIAGTACAVAGFLGADGTLLYNGNLPWLEGQSLVSCLQSGAGLPWVVESDSNAACAGESLFGAGVGVHRLLCLTVGTGVGVGMMVDGALVRTAYGCLGDAGHVIVAPEGPHCTCGGQGCAEAVLSTVTLGRRFGEGGFRGLVAGAAAKESRALTLTANTGTALGIAAASLASIFVPDRIVIAGGLAHLGVPLLRAAECSFQRHAGLFIHRRAHLALAYTGSDATLLGAAACFFAQHPRLAEEEP